MKTFVAYLLLLSWSLPSLAANNGKYEAFRALAEKHRTESKKEGMAYVVGGSAGLTFSVALGINSKEPLPKIGYSLIQVLSAAAIVHGASLYGEGDNLTQEADRLAIFEQQLNSQKDLSTEQKKKILDDATAEVLRAEVQRYKHLRRIRGYLELATVASTGATLALSKSKSSASNSALGFIMLISLVGAYSDLLGSVSPENVQELYTFDVEAGPKGTQLAWTMRW